MISKSQYKINKAYNHFIFKLVSWNYLYNKVNTDKEQGYEPTKNYEKMVILESYLLSILDDIEQLDRSNVKSFFPLLDDIALLQKFKDTVK